MPVTPSPPAAGDERRELPALVHLAVIWVVWGSTYLAIRVAVQPGAGFGPFWLGALRVLVAGVLLLLIARLRSVPIRIGRRDLAVLAASGLLLWLGGNGGVLWAEQHIDSGLAALIVGTLPLSVALLESAIDRRAPSALLAAALLTGFGGVAVLTVPLFRDGLSGTTLGVLAVVLGSLSWGAGSLLQRRRPVRLHVLASSGLQHLFGGAGFVAAAILVGEPAPSPTPAAWGAWAYLVVFGSLVAFTSFVAALERLPTRLVMTYAYVNPVIAVVLGCLILGEPITWSTVAGAALVLVGVAGVFRDTRRRRDAA